jgi:hypothetical protein
VAEGVEKSGASFSFSGDNAVFTWSEVPSDEIITLKYKIIADPSATGTKTISGVFSYLDENERAKYDIPNIIFDVTSSGAVAQTDPDPIVVTDPDPVETTDPDPVATTDPMEVISCLRVVEQDGDEFIVSLNIEKAAYGGFARVKEYIPAGFIATKVQTENAVFKSVGNSVKFIWTSIPKDKSALKLVYKLTPTSAADGVYTLTGEFSGEFMIVNDVPKKFTIPKSTFTVEGQLASGGGSEGGGSEGGGSESGGSEGGGSEGAASTIVITPAVSGVSYKVQILAAHKNVSSRYIKKRYGFSDKVNLENHDGWVKYVTGSFSVYKDARNKRESLSSYDLPGPFVTAYNTGERISVQEALTITSQDWVK